MKLIEDAAQVPPAKTPGILDDYLMLYGLLPIKQTQGAYIYMAALTGSSRR